MQTSVPKLFIGKNGANAVTTAGTNMIINEPSVTLRDIYFLDSMNGANHGNLLDATALGLIDRFNIAYGAANKQGLVDTFYSPVVSKARIKKVTRDPYTAPTQQISYIGYDGVDATKDITLVNGKPYNLNITLRADAKLNDYKEPFGPITTASTLFAGATPTVNEKLAFLKYFVDTINGNIAGSNSYSNANQSSALSSYIQAELIFGGTATAAGTNGTATQGSTLVTTSAAHSITVGSYVRIGTGVGSGVYKVVAVPTTTTLTLDTPYLGASFTAVASSVSTLGGTAIAGIKLTGKNQPLVKYSNKNIVRFDAGFMLSDQTAYSLLGGYRAVITTTPAVFGSGTYEYLFEREMAQDGYNGLYNYDNFPANVEPFRFSELANTYHIYTIEFEEFGQDDFDVSRKLKTYEIFTVVGSAQETALLALISTLPNYTAIS